MAGRERKRREGEQSIDEPEGGGGRATVGITSHLSSMCWHQHSHSTFHPTFLRIHHWVSQLQHSNTIHHLNTYIYIYTIYIIQEFNVIFNYKAFLYY